MYQIRFVFVLSTSYLISKLKVDIKDQQRWNVISGALVANSLTFTSACEVYNNPSESRRL